MRVNTNYQPLLDIYIGEGARMGEQKPKCGAN